MSYFNGAVLRTLRQRQRLSISQVHELTGVSRAQISKIETGKADPRVSTVAELLSCYGASFADIETTAPATVEMETLLERGAVASKRLQEFGIGPSDPGSRLDRRAEMGEDVSAEREALATRQ